MTLPYPTIISQRRVVPNLQPFVEPHPYKIAVIGEAPGESEENYGVPFVGQSGQFLDRILRDVGIDRRRIFVGNVCQVRPPANDLNRFDWLASEIQDGISQLRSDLATFNPNVLLLLGNVPIHAAKLVEPPPRDKGKHAWPHTINKWCGSLFLSPTFGYKSVAGFHPAGILRQWGDNFPRLKLAAKRALEEGTSPELILPQRELITSYDAQTLCHLLDTWQSGLRCSLDIEGGLPTNRVNIETFKPGEKRFLNWRCVSLSARPTKAFAISWWKFTEYEHAIVWQSFARLMYRNDVPKVLQNSLYDSFVCAYGYDTPIRNVVEDTMLKGWEVYCELPKGLSCQASIWTREPHWKDEEMYQSTSDALAVGCCKDSAVTLELCNAQDNVLRGSSLAHYRANVSMLNPLLYMELRGIKYDTEQVAKRFKEVKETGWTEKDKDGKETFHPSITAVGQSLVETCGQELRGEKGSLGSQRLADCLYQQAPKPTPKGRIRQLPKYLTSAYPPQYAKEAGRKTDKLTTDVEALLSLRRKCPDDNFLSGILRHRHLEGLLETLSIRPDKDGRVRCGYNVVGTETGRLTCYTSPTGAGSNLTTITKSLRYNYAADPGYDFFQCDLEGADGWTVAAHCARLGDTTMLDDYRAGLKPAKIIALLYYFGAVINQVARDDLKWLHDVVFPIVLKEVGKWLYLGCKRVQHGSNYLMGIPTMIWNVLHDSFKESGTPVYLEHSVASNLQRLYFARYWGVPKWHQWAEHHLVTYGTLESASGQVRTFFGRRFGPSIHDTVKEFLAHEPQSNTTWATNLAMLRLWNDPDNRRTDSSLIIEPLHTVHDALCGQWPQSIREWARHKMKTYFDNPMTIAGTTLTIPFDGAWGPSWGELPNKL